jgi:hypothetical protein
MAREPIRVYADTSVFGGVFDADFAGPSQWFFDQVGEGAFVLVISGLVQREIAGAPDKVRDLFMKTLPTAETAVLTEAAVALRQAYLRAGVVTEKWSDDAMHVAIASCAGCDLIVSWNFQHIVHSGKIARYNEVNAAQGCGSIAIQSPEELMGHEAESL